MATGPSDRPETAPAGEVPGLDSAWLTRPATDSSPRRPPSLSVTRVDANAWLVVSGSSVPEVVHGLSAAATTTASPAALLRDVAREWAGNPLLVMRVEHDACGAWVTMATVGHPRPLVVRRAGWVDLRGHPLQTVADLDPERGPVEDRVGLGPGDSLVVLSEGLAHALSDDGTRLCEEGAYDALLDAAGVPAADQAAALLDLLDHHRWEGPLAAGVLRVPVDLGDDPRARVEAITGLTGDDLQLPGYPLGDLQPELWTVPPRPPREARVRLDPVASNVPGVRELLSRLLASWRLERMVDQDDVHLLATELTTNAVRHADTPLTVIMRYLGDTFRVEVTDRSPVLPVRRNPAPHETSGRGIMLVDAIASAWGVNPSPDGKRVWCEVPVQPVPPADLDVVSPA